ncbi:MAG: SAM-dependent methyltransferase, partial [Acidobacteria bacterium]
MSTITTLETTRKSDELAERVLGSAVGALELFSIYLGDKLGFYQALAQHGPATSRQLAGRAGADERYVREWLEQQAVSGLLAVENPLAQEANRRFYLPEGHEEVLANRESLNFLSPLAQLVVGATYP